MAFVYDGYAYDDDDEEDDDSADEEAFLPWTSNTSQTNAMMDYPKSPPIESGSNFQFTYGADELQGEGTEEIPLPKMPEEFYNGVENFLSRSPPKLKSKKRLEIEGANTITGLTKHASAPALPRSNMNAKSKQQAPVRRNIDPSLLSEAFAYTDKILREAVLEEAHEAAIAKHAAQSQGSRDTHPKNGGKKPRSAGSVLEKSSHAYLGGGNNSASQQARKPRSAKDRLGAGLVKRLRQTATSNSSAGGSGRAASMLAGGAGQGPDEIADFTVTAVSEDAGSRKIVDFDAMVANLSQGVMMRKLQAELAASQQSMQRSSVHIRELAGKAGFNYR